MRCKSDFDDESAMEMGRIVIWRWDCKEIVILRWDCDGMDIGNLRRKCGGIGIMRWHRDLAMEVRWICDEYRDLAMRCDEIVILRWNAMES